MEQRGEVTEIPKKGIGMPLVNRELAEQLYLKTVRYFTVNKYSLR